MNRKMFLPILAAFALLTIVCLPHKQEVVSVCAVGKCEEFTLHGDEVYVDVVTLDVWADIRDADLDTIKPTLMVTTSEDGIVESVTLDGEQCETVQNESGDFEIHC